MPLLGTLLASLAGSLASFLANIWAKKVGVAFLAASGITGLTIGLLILFNNLVAPLVQAMFTTTYGQFIGLAFPPVAGSCMATIGLTWTACAVYRLKVATIKISASA